MNRKKPKSKNDGKAAKDEKLTEKEKKNSSLLSSILKKYPWPVQEYSKGNTKIKNVKENITQHIFDEKEISNQIPEYDQEEMVSTVECPECGKIFVGLDENGCCVRDYGRCEDVIGEGDDGDFSFKKEFELLADVLSIYNDYIYGDTYVYVSLFTGVNLKEEEDWSIFLEELGISITSNEWDGGGPGSSGNYAFLIVDRDLQGDLLKKLEVIKNRLSAFEEADRIGKFETQNHCEIIADLVDVYGTNISASNLMSLINYNTPPIGHLTTMLLINWLKKKDDLTKPNGFDPLNDYIFLNWLAKGRQKEIMKSLEENITKDTAVAEVYEYLKKISSQYVNEEMPRFGGQYNFVPINRYKSNKELYSGFYVSDSGKSKKKAIGAKVSHTKKQTV